MTDIRAWLDQGKTLADRAADHVGRLSSGEDRWTMTVPPKDTDSDIALMSLLDGRLPQALDALEAVLNLHKLDPDDSMPSCSHCLDAWENTADWPCATVRAITDAIGDRND